ncbi:MAG: HlyD family secretion protein [Labilithrix sp.]|nr:HlyD family secretion protein [Labilithrix sp.]
MSTAVMGTEPEAEIVKDADPRLAGAPPAKKRTKAKLVLGGLAVTFATIGAAAWLAGRGKESTDDAFVEAHVASVAARIQGQVVRVGVKDNQLVEVGDVLVEIDDRDAKVRLTTAEADLLSAKANLSAFETQLALTEKNIAAALRQAKGGVVQASALAGSSRATIEQAKADVDAAESRRALAELDLRRTEKLYGDGAVAEADLDAKRALHDQAVAAVAQARAREDSALVGLTNAAGSIETAQGRLAAANAGPEQVEAARAAVAVAKARVAQAEAAVEQAKLALSYTEVKAQVRGVVSRRSVEVGQTVDPSRPLMAITALDDVWVVANFKEDQIAEIAPGQTATIEVDAFHGRKLTGHVDSLSGGSGARFSLLPPDNASGNFTKVVQRIPVLVRFDDPPKDVTLRPGMSTYVTIRTAR